jgi:hypothetical protein
MRRFTVAHMRLIPSDGTCREEVVRVYDVEARDGRSAIVKARYQGACPMVGTEFLVASRRRAI